MVELDDGHGNKARACAYHRSQIDVQPAQTAAGLGLIWDGDSNDKETQ